MRVMNVGNDSVLIGLLKDDRERFVDEDAHAPTPGASVQSEYLVSVVGGKFGVPNRVVDKFLVFLSFCEEDEVNFVHCAVSLKGVEGA